MFLKKIFLLILLLKLDCGEPTPEVCKQEGKQVQVLPALIPEHSSPTPEGYEIDWKTAINPLEFAKCFDTVTLYYNGRPDTSCCHGYEDVIKEPKKTGDTKPFVVSLCGNQTTVFVSFKLGGEKKAEIQLTNLEPCSFDGDFYLSRVVGIVLFAIVFVITVLSIIYCFVKRNSIKQGDEESTGSSASEEISGSDGSSHESSISRKSNQIKNNKFKVKKLNSFTQDG